MRSSGVGLSVLVGGLCACVAGDVDPGVRDTTEVAEDPVPRLVVETVVTDQNGFEYGPGEQADILPDGGVVFADRQAGALHLFSPDGRYLRSVGRRGEGPGEFDALVDVEVGPNGELAAGDFAALRVTVFDSDGELTHTMRTPFPNGRPRIHWSEAGLFLHVASRATVGNETSSVQGIFRAEMSAPPEPGTPGAAQFRSWWHPGYDTLLDGDSITCVNCPLLAGPNGGIALVSPRPLYRVVEFDSTGAEMARWGKPDAEPIPIPEEEREEFRKRMQDFYDQLGLGTYNREVSTVRMPLPRSSDVGFDGRGRMWARPALADRDAVRPLEVFEADGGFLGIADVPAPPGWRGAADGGVEFTPLNLRVRGDRLLVVAKDEWDLAVIVVYRIEG